MGLTTTPLSTPSALTPNAPTGRIHSVETCGTVDGPGIRYVVFTQGCPLRCLYCHNPDCREIEGGQEMTVAELMNDIQRYQVYMNASGGGVTATGGEPLLQPEFVAALFRQCQAQGIHTALDTSGYCDLSHAQPVLDHTNLVLLDIKSFDPAIYRQVTSVSLRPTLSFAKHLADLQIPTWIRFVLVPGLTDPIANVADLAEFVANLPQVERVEVLPFHQMGAYKWAQLGYDYALTETEPPSPALLERVRDQFRRHGLVVQ